MQRGAILFPNTTSNHLLIKLSLYECSAEHITAVC